MDNNNQHPPEIHDDGGDAGAGTTEHGNYGRSRAQRRSRHSRRGRCGPGRANWSPMNIAGVAIGFMILPPVGLALLVWVLTGRQVVEIPNALREVWDRFSGGQGGFNGLPRSGNVVFDDYQRTQYERIREIQDEIQHRAGSFREWRADARRRADQEEFDRFMSSGSR